MDKQNGKNFRSMLLDKLNKNNINISENIRTKLINRIIKEIDVT